MRLRHLRSAVAMAVVASAVAIGVGMVPAAAGEDYTFSFIVGANDFDGTGPADEDLTRTLPLTRR